MKKNQSNWISIIKFGSQLHNFSPCIITRAESDARFSKNGHFPFQLEIWIWTAKARYEIPQDLLSTLIVREKISWITNTPGEIRLLHSMIKDDLLTDNAFDLTFFEWKEVIQGGEIIEGKGENKSNIFDCFFIDPRGVLYFSYKITRYNT